MSAVIKESRSRSQCDYAIQPVSKPLLQSWIAFFSVRFDGRCILYQWIGGTRRNCGGQGHFRTLTKESEVWAMAAGFEAVVVKTKNRYYEMRAVLAQLHFNVVKHEPHPTDTNESRVYFSKLLPTEVARDHRLTRTVVQAE